MFRLLMRGLNFQSTCAVALVTSNQCRGFSKPRADFSYEGFEKPSSSGYEYPEAHWRVSSSTQERIQQHVRRGIGYSNQCRGFSKPRADFSYRGFEKPASSGYEYPEAHRSVSRSTLACIQKHTRARRSTC